MVNATVTNLLNEILEDELNSSIGEIIQNYQAQQISTANANLTVGELSKQTKEFTTTRVEYYSVKQ